MKSTRTLLFSFNSLKNFSKDISKLKGNPTIFVKMKQRFFSMYLLASNILLTMGFSGMGDITEQFFEITAKYQDKWDVQRTLKLTATGMPVGIICHYWYIYLDKHYFHTNHATIFKKVFLSQIIFSPVCIFVFFLTLGFINRSSKEEVYKNLRTKGKRIYLVEWAVWPPASLINFYLVPLRYRVLYDNIISFGFDIYNSYVVHKHLRKDISHSVTNEQSFSQTTVRPAGISK